MSAEFYCLDGKSVPRYTLLQSWFRAGRGQKGRPLHWHTFIRKKGWLLPTVHGSGVSGQGDSVGT
eukprot:5270860-Lingulodinium_polyedra.AAC.1